MPTEITGFVGFTQQGNDVLDPKSAATITEYLRSMFQSGTLGLSALSANLAAHIADHNNPHRDGVGPALAYTVYDLLYQYYVDMCQNTPMSHDAFVEMMKSPVFLEMCRRLVLDRKYFDLTMTGSDPQLPFATDNAYYETGDYTRNTGSPGYPTFEEFLKAAGGMTNWNVFAYGDGIQQRANHCRPVFYTRIGLPPVVTTNDIMAADYGSLENIALTNMVFPILIGCRYTSQGAVPTNTVLFSLDFGNTTYYIGLISHSQNFVISTNADLSSPLIDSISTSGRFWVEFTDTTTATLGEIWSRSETNTGPAPALPPTNGQVTLSIPAPISASAGTGEIQSLAIFSGLIDTTLMQLQTSYL